MVPTVLLVAASALLLVAALLVAVPFGLAAGGVVLGVWAYLLAPEHEGPDATD